MREWWLSATTVGGYQFHRDESVTDIRPQVPLDLDGYSGERAVNYLRNLARESRDVMGNTPSPRGKLALLIADQIEAQTKPKRIPEPGQFGVVEAGGDHSPGRHKWVRQGDLWWNGAAWTTWETLTDPVLVREGVDDE